MDKKFISKLKNAEPLEKINIVNKIIKNKELKIYKNFIPPQNNKDNALSKQWLNNQQTIQETQQKIIKILS
ncbi:MAG: hypothetical protein WCS88_01835 [Patescibacteria group bacterium]